MKKDLTECITKATKMLEHHAQMRNVYFFTPPGHASARRSYEKKHTMKMEFEYLNHTYSYESDCKCSCKHIYFTDGFQYDGKKTTSKRIENILAKMRESGLVTAE